MKINNLSIKNARRIEEAKLDFSKVNLISGETGSGKSTIFECLELLLFNSCKSKVPELINYKAKKVKIKSNIEHLNKNLDYEYKYGSSSGRKLKIDKDYESDDTTEILAKLKSLYDFDLYKNSILMMQKSDDITKMKASDCRDLLKTIYNSSFEQSEKELDEEIKQLEKEDLRSYEDNLIVLNNKNYNIKDLLLLNITKEKYYEYTTEIERLVKEKELFSLKLREYTSYIERIKSIENESDACVSKLTKNSLSIENVIKELASRENELNTTFFEETINILEEKLKGIRLKRVSSFDDDNFEKLKKSQTTFENEILNLKKEIRLCKSGRCPTCNNTFNSTDVNERELKLSDKEKELLIIVEQVEVLKVSKKEIEEISKNNVIAKADKVRISSNIESERSNIKLRKNNLTIQIDNLYDKKESLQKDEIEINNLIKSLNSKLEVEKESNIVKPDNTINYDTTLTNLKEDVKEYDRITTTNKTIEKDNSILILEKKNDILDLKKCNTDIEKVKGIIFNKKEAKKMLKTSIPNYIIKQSSVITQKYMNEFMFKAYSGEYELKLDNQRTGVSFQYRNRAENSDKWRAVVNLSGYESSVVKLAWNYALAKQSGAGILIIDEPTAHASTTMGLKLWKLIKSIINEFDQIFIICHNEVEKEFIENELNAKHFLVENGKISCKN